MYSRFQFKIALCLLLALIHFANLYPQNKQGIQVKNLLNDQNYAYPWAGGMNACQFGEIDLDQDGLKDLFVFDRMGDRIMTFLNKGIPDSIAYEYAPQYAFDFPELYDWVIFRDYDQDGKNDIFTYAKGLAGMLVFRNVSSGGELKFKQMVDPFLTSFQGGGYTNILVTYADYPGIVDLDDDGDLDILTFWGLGSFVELHKNLSMEKYGIPDSLDYEKIESCWGQFAESDESNTIYLDTCFGKSLKFKGKEERHTGSTFLVNDMDGDGVKDLVLGDVDYAILVLLMNGGENINAFMISQDWNFPQGTKQANLFSMPAPMYLDVNMDGRKDLILSPFDPNPYVTQNLHSTHLYLNYGMDDAPDFNFTSSQFLQNEMIDLGSGAYPVFLDVNGDGLQDMIVGNYGYYDSSWMDDWYFLHSAYTSSLALFLNTGTAGQPEFNFYDPDFAGLSELSLRGLVPAFADLDGDNDLDMLCGQENGELLYFENTATSPDTMIFTLKEEHYQDIDVGEYSTPQLFDLTQNGLPDLVIGEKRGNLNYFPNAGTPDEPVFTLKTDSLGGILVTDFSVSNYGYSHPAFFKYQEETRLIVGSESGKLFYFTNIDNNLGGDFTKSDSLAYLVDTTGFSFFPAFRSAAAIEDLDQDGYPELIAGNFSGGMHYYSMGSAHVSPDVPQFK